MKTLRLLLCVLPLMAIAPAQVSGNDPATLDPDAPHLTAEQLDQLLGPIALYPDALIAIILPATTAPADIVLAARHLQANANDLSQVENRAWDDSVKSLTRYPEVLKWLDENLPWTQQVGEAFLVQPAEVMESIQRLRAKAQAAGTLIDTPQQVVLAEPEAIRIVPAQPDTIYVPYYDPAVVFIDRPVYYYPRPFLTFSTGFAVGSWLAYDCDWRHRTIWVGNRFRPWHRHDWTQPLIPIRPAIVHTAPVSRVWQPAPRLNRPTYYRPSAPYRPSQPYVGSSTWHGSTSGSAPAAGGQVRTGHDRTSGSPQHRGIERAHSLPPGSGHRNFDRSRNEPQTRPNNARTGTRTAIAPPTPPAPITPAYRSNHFNRQDRGDGRSHPSEVVPVTTLPVVPPLQMQGSTSRRSQPTVVPSAPTLTYTPGATRMHTPGSQRIYTPGTSRTHTPRSQNTYTPGSGRTYAPNHAAASVPSTARTHVRTDSRAPGVTGHSTHSTPSQVQSPRSAPSSKPAATANHRGGRGNENTRPAHIPAER